MKKRFTEEQILQVLNTAREGKTIAEICRTYGISVVTYYKWKENSTGCPCQMLKDFGISKMKTAN